jgi:hypothetical protein
MAESQRRSIEYRLIFRDRNIGKVVFRLESNTGSGGGESIRWHLKKNIGEIMCDSGPYGGFRKNERGFEPVAARGSLYLGSHLVGDFYEKNIGYDNRLQEASED